MDGLTDYFTTYTCTLHTLSKHMYMYMSCVQVARTMYSEWSMYYMTGLIVWLYFIFLELNCKFDNCSRCQWASKKSVPKNNYFARIYGVKFQQRPLWRSNERVLKIRGAEFLLGIHVHVHVYGID